MRINAETIEYLIDIVRHTGDIIMRHYSGTPTITRKADNSPVTECDIECDRFITQELKHLFPAIPVFSEEAEGENDFKGAEIFWLVDPLDGTRSFIKRSGIFTVNLGLIEHNAPVFGAIHNPLNGATYYGGKKHQSFIETSRGSKRPLRTDPNNNTALVSSEKAVDENNWLTENFAGVKVENHSSSIKFCFMAEGKAKVYPRMRPTHEWDTAAGQAILEGAGGRVLDTAGKPMQYGKPELLNGHFFAYAT